MIWGLLYLIAGLIAVACATQFFVKVGFKKVSITFGAGMISLVLICFSASAIFLFSPENQGLGGFLFRLADKLIPFAGAISPYLFLLISRNYGRIEDKSVTGLSVLTRLGGLMTLIIIFFIATGLAFQTIYTATEYAVILRGFLAKSIGLALGVLMIMSFLNFSNTWRISAGALKRQILILMVINILQIGGLVRIFFLGSMSIEFAAYFAPVILISLAGLYIFLLHRDFYSADIVIDRQAYMSSAVILFLGIVLVLTGIIAYVLEQLGGPIDVFLSIIGAFLVIGLFLVALVSDSIRSRFSGAILSRIYAGRFDYKAEWRGFSEDFASSDNIDELLTMLSEKVDRLLKPLKSAIYMKEGEHYICKRPVINNLPQISESDSAIYWIFLKSESARFSEIQDTSASDLKKLENEYEILVPIDAQKQLIGFILLSGKDDSTPYNTEDFAILSAISHQVAITIMQFRSQARLIETEKLASFHKTSSFVVHDLKNAVSMLSLMLQNAPHKMSDPEFQKESIRTIRGAVARMEHIIEKLKSPPGKEQLHMYPLDPEKVLANAIEKSGIKNKDGVELVIENDRFKAVMSDRVVLENVFINLLINAIEAMPNGGRITIRQHFLEGKKPAFSVTDTGIGMPSSFVENQLFHPFATTKAKGLGIGLYQCREMLRETGGDLKAESEPGRGSTFTLIFPG